MKNNPFHDQPMASSQQYYNWQQLMSKPLPSNSHCVDRLYNVLLLATTQHSMLALDNARHIQDNDIRRRLANISRVQMQQHIRLCTQIPTSNSMLVHAIDICHLQIQLSASISSYENNKYIKQSIDYILLEHSDQLYRLANLANLDNIDVVQLVDDLVEIMPTRPSICQHLHPHDCIKRFSNYKQCQLSSIVHITLLHAVARYAYQYYSTILAHYPHTTGRQLLAELCHIASQHCSIYGSLVDTYSNQVEILLICQYTQCYSYYLCISNNGKHYMQHYQQQLYNLHSIANILQHSCEKLWQQVLGNGKYPSILQLAGNNDYIRQILTDNISLTSQQEDYVHCATLEPDCSQCLYQQQLHHPLRKVPSHSVVASHIADKGKDFRHMHTMHPIEQLEDRQHDNTTLGRIT